MVEIIFKKSQSDFSDVDTTRYTKVFINATKEDKLTKISLSKYKGDILYICSNKDYEDIYEYFKIPEVVKEVKNPVITQSTNKKSKQGNLFGFIKKKK